MLTYRNREKAEREEAHGLQPRRGYRSKWNRQDYRERTIARAIAATHDFYKPPVDIPSLPLDPEGPVVEFDLDDANMEAL